MNRIVIDLDGTLTQDEPGVPYPEKAPRPEVIAKLREYREAGFAITISTARNMRTYSGNTGLINIHTLPGIIEWLRLHDVPFDEVLVGKPWCGVEGFYVDDRALRPDEFARLSQAEVAALFGTNVS
jgi:capsule biosynthesis phosphatase